MAESIMDHKQHIPGINQDSPAPQELTSAVPLGYTDMSSPGTYMVKFYARALRNALRQHRPALDQAHPEVEASFSFSQEHQKRWFDFFNVSADNAVRPPLVYASIAGATAMFRLATMAGINMKYLLHLQNEFVRFQGAPALEPNRCYTVSMGINDVLPYAGDRSVVVFRSQVRDEHDRRVLEARDYMFVRKCPAPVQPVRQHHNHHTDLLAFRELKTRVPEWPAWASSNHVQASVHLPANSGIEFGRLGGDLNIVHTHALGAKMFGFTKPFIQGYCTANHVIAQVTKWSPIPITQFQILFVRPVFVNQRIDIHYHPAFGRFEVCDESGALVAYGRCARSECIDREVNVAQVA